MLPYFLANLLILPLCTIFQHILVCKTTSIRHPKFYILFFPAVSTAIWVINNYVLETPTILCGALIIIGTPLAAILSAQKGCRIQALLAMTVYMGVQTAVYYILGLIAFPLAQAMGFTPADLINTTSSYGNAIMAGICFLVCCPFLYCSHLLLKKLFDSPRLSVWLLWFLPIPISQTIMINLFNHIVPYSGGLNGLTANFILAIILSIIADISFFVGAARVQRSEYLKQQVSLAEEQLKIQEGYYRQLQDKILLVNQIRHDLSNQLQAAYHLLEMGEKNQVRKQLDQLQDDLQDHVGTQFCANLMVDAILSEKKKICQENGIHLDIHAELPADIPIVSAHLCSAFSNLLDNGIQGVSACIAGEKTIKLRTAVKNGCLVIHCINPANAPAKKQSADLLRLHGLGLSILERIAAEYNGDLHTAYHDEKFDAVLTLCFPKHDPASRTA